jgi:hypothetical protein
MASGTADLQRDLGGAILQSLFGALLAAGYASAVNSQLSGLPTAEQARVTDSVQAELTKSFSSAALTAQRYPQYADQIVAGAKESFIQGKNWAYVAGIVAVLIGGVLVFTMFPKREQEEEMIAGFQREDAGARVTG